MDEPGQQHRCICKVFYHDLGNISWTKTISLPKLGHVIDQRHLSSTQQNSFNKWFTNSDNDIDDLVTFLNIIQKIKKTLERVFL